MDNHSKGFPISHVIGFFMSLVLTFGAAWIALQSSLSMTAVMWIIGTLAVIQAGIQLYMFMHINESNDRIANNINIIYSAFIAVVIVAGSIWVMTSGHSH
ncbi:MULTISPECIES: cytochrome aa3 quinol oxidase subunit IV [Mesobacillus]|uniref:Quinol oxidase subunit 4 n=2 Tax=Mesobacillus TaxID=2675231 RepID=A0A0D6ZDY2_9BACI|nr:MULTISPECIES: cytochrome aa3 quinol oxidase subunit IV [Mesobacillus]KIY22793.1 quinol oxidase subunit 4 [Mesobacillus subterraneus]MDQ0413241.1 cytochrome aa3-600 menaquinol oxidase subunit 4 [Mesobacillus stamsii]